MTRRVWVAIALGMCAASPAAAETIEAESKLTAVTVFPDRAEVTRSIALKLSRGGHTLVVGPLPAHVEPESVTAKGAGEAKVTLYGVRLVTKQLETAQDPKAKTLEEEIRKVQQHQQQLRGTKHVLQEERQYLGSIQAASGEQLGKELVTKSPSASDAASLLAFLDEAFLKNLERDQGADLELDDLSRQLDRLQRELAQLTQGQYRQETVIHVDLDAQEGGAFLMAVSYRLPGATWQPAYEARATIASDAVEMDTSGVVRQQTGEDWTNVRVTLSTARPAIAGSMPELQPWFLRPWEPVASYFRKAARLQEAAEAPSKLLADRAGKDEDGRRRETKAQDQAAVMATAAVAAQGPSVTFTLPKSESIPGDWQPHKLPIGSSRLAAKIAYETTPRLVPQAFLRAKVTNTTDLLYLPAPVSVFLDGAFVATSALKQVAPGQEFDLYLGVDERVKVERKPLKERVEVSLLPGVHGKTKSTDYEFLTTIENFTGRRIAVTAFDQVPVSDREEIVVESVKQTPSAIEKDTEKPGVFRWALDLAPNQKQELKLSYRVRHPVDMQIQ